MIRLSAVSCHVLSLLSAAILLVGTVYWRDGAVDLEHPEEGRLASQRGRQGSSIGGDLGKEHAALIGQGGGGYSARAFSGLIV